MKIAPMDTNDERILEIFSEHDDYMIEFLGKDSRFYTRYSKSENIEKVWGAYVENRLAGCIAYRERAAGVGEVKRMFVRKEYRGMGLSKNLLDTVERHAKARGCSALFLDTRITLEPAFSIYRASGYDIILQQDLYVQMEKKL